MQEVNAINGTEKSNKTKDISYSVRTLTYLVSSTSHRTYPLHTIYQLTPKETMRLSVL